MLSFHFPHSACHGTNQSSTEATGRYHGNGQALNDHDGVIPGEWHGDKQEHEWFRKLVSTPEFADRADDVVMEFGNSLYQKISRSLHRWRGCPSGTGAESLAQYRGRDRAPSPVYGLLYQTVRKTNQKRRGKRQIRILCGDPYIDWEKVKDREDVGPYLGNCDQWYAQVVKNEVLAKKHHALLIAGGGHCLRWNGPGYIELRAAGAQTFFVVFGTNAVGDYDDLDKRFESWPMPAIVSLPNNWVGDLPEPGRNRRWCQ